MNVPRRIRLASPTVIATATATLLLALASTAAHAVDVHVMQAWSRASTPGANEAVGYVTLHNGSGKAQRLLGASSPRAESVEMHESRVNANGVSEMRPLAEVTIPADGMVRFEPNGKHLMLVGLKGPLKAGEKVPVTLRFEGEAPLEVVLDVRPLGSVAAPGKEHEHH
jgi:copper(I)-binding protein